MPPPNVPIVWCDATGLIAEYPISGQPGETYSMRFPRTRDGLASALGILAEGAATRPQWHQGTVPVIRGTPERQESAAAIVREMFITGPNQVGRTRF